MSLSSLCFQTSSKHLVMPSISVTSWNIDGLRHTGVAQSVIDYLTTHSPDILCLQEIKCSEIEARLALKSVLKDESYTLIVNSCSAPHLGDKAMRHHGIAVLISHKVLIDDDFTCKILPVPDSLTSYYESDGTEGKRKVNMLSGNLREGRIITLSCKKACMKDPLLVVCTYCPNTGIGKKRLQRLPYRIHGWDASLRDYLKTLRYVSKNILWIGDLNVAPHVDDIYGERGEEIFNGSNAGRVAGNTKEEKASFTQTLSECHMRLASDKLSDKKKASLPYTFQSANGRLLQWRLDHAVVSSELWNRVTRYKVQPDATKPGHRWITVNTTFPKTKPTVVKRKRSKEEEDIEPMEESEEDSEEEEEEESECVVDEGIEYMDDPYLDSTMEAVVADTSLPDPEKSRLNILREIWALRSQTDTGHDPTLVDRVVKHLLGPDSYRTYVEGFARGGDYSWRTSFDYRAELGYGAPLPESDLDELTTLIDDQ